ncbi:MAG TPA: DUF4157 domain-containing protein, partial [Pyrinomonadaceae bacterium]|nr:DUF4157 domain-containing protein [Pyrinomonadaceae bacterium]
MLMPDTTVRLQRKCGCGECGECAGGPPNVQLRAAAGSEPRDAQPAVDYALNSGGRPLDAETLSFMETRFGHDFGGVRVHTGERAAESARSLGARAYTVG